MFKNKGELKQRSNRKYRPTSTLTDPFQLFYCCVKEGNQFKIVHNIDGPTMIFPGIPACLSTSNQGNVFIDLYLTYYLPSIKKNAFRKLME